MITVGMKVRVRNDPSKIGVATDEISDVNGRAYRTVELAAGQRKKFQEALLEPLLEAPDALADLAAGRLSAAGDLGQLLTHVRLTGRLADLIYSMEATNTDFHAYQFKPVIKILNSASKGLLIADEVGLGKTIEAGLVWTELVARYDVQRLLVVCPKSLQEKWRLELRNKFGARAREVNAGELLAALKEAEAHGGDFALVATLPGVRAPKDWDDKESSKTPRAELARYLNAREGGEPLFDMVVFDEAHHLRNPATAQHQTARRFTELADYKLMLSATPINLKDEDLRSILRLLEPELFDRAWIFEELQRENEPIVAARELAMNPKIGLSEVAHALDSIQPGQLLKTDRRLEILKAQLRKDHTTGTPARRADIASRLEEMSMLGGVVNRTRRRDVAEIQVQRRVDTRVWSMSDEERAFYDEASLALRDYAWEADVSDRFLLAQSQRMLASCLPAAYRRWGEVKADFGLEGDDEEDQAPRKAPGPLVSALASHCTDKGRYAVLRNADQKFAMLRQALDDTWSRAPDDKLIIFSSFQGTLDYLEERLAAEGTTSIKMHGGVKKDRSDLLRNFAEVPGRSILLTSEIGGEGLDLQFCRILVNYDLPWNPMRVEQRIGRIDRIGQRSPTVEVINLICQGTIEARVYERLYQRLELIEKTLGGFEPILGALVAGLEGRLLDPKLRPEEIDAEIDREATAAENRKRIEDALEEQAAGLIAHGDMILNRIKRTHEQQRWIQAGELYEYVKAGLLAAFPGTTLDRTSHEFEAYELRMSATCHLAFKSFLEDRARRSDTQLRRGEPVTIVFGKRPEGARSSKIEVVMPTHPLVRFIAKVREDNSQGLASRPALSGRLSRTGLARPVKAGRYGIAIQRWSVGGLTPQDKLVYAAINLETGTVLSDEDAEAVVGAMVEGLEPRTASPDRIAQDATYIAEHLVAQVMAAREAQFVAFEEAVHEDKRDTVLAVLQRQLESHASKANLQIQIYLAKGGRTAQIVPAERAKLAKYTARMEQKIEIAKGSAAFEFEDPITLGVAAVEIY
jgi:superfamily II DNA or RNA helicase